MYQIKFKDSREHTDHMFRTYEQAKMCYASVVSTCLQNDIPFAISLSDENGECIASSDFNVHSASVYAKEA